MIELLLRLGQCFLVSLAIVTILATLYMMFESCDFKEWLIVFVVGTVVSITIIFLYILLSNIVLKKQAEADAINEKILALSLNNSVTIEEISPYKKYIELANIDERKNLIVVCVSDGVSISDISKTKIVNKPAIAINIYETSEFDFQLLKKNSLQDDMLYAIAYLSIDDDLTLKQLMEYSEYITFKDDISAEHPIQLTFYEQNDCIFAVASNRQ